MLDRATGEALLARLDAALNEVAEVRRQVVELMPPAEGNGLDSLADALIDTASAAARFGLARDTVAKVCREIPGVGTWKGGRWQVRVGAMRQHLERKNNQ